MKASTEIQRRLVALIRAHGKDYGITLDVAQAENIIVRLDPPTQNGTPSALLRILPEQP